ncbi:ligase-associated DNA damage response endonuclease PdeM [Mesonia sp. HuA40]|uniref:ligase-associated DNA damage response endonuclease PdeM n=1 Tax=Mesonia sp. HuA40 TaxID=2602761 RepID=UPI0011C8936E|nr:ligase-associated DNA damage response endonuclease PdeM [Mesonia sp. HuA40]TXK72494.1 ligase-associated DNA damage response endonuclease PdeM [Mesonia sp. HuA40]
MITIKDQHFTPDASGVLFWENNKILLVADVHFGKIAHFRKYGSAVPSSAITVNFKKLDEAIKKYNPRKLIFLGDLFHSDYNQEFKLFEHWVKHQNCSILLIKGNHDIVHPSFFKKANLEVLPHLIIGDFYLTHKPEHKPNLFTLCGHLHPGYALSGLGRQKLRLPCFYQTENQMILPAFGTFTGLYLVKSMPNESVYVCTQNEVIKVQ